MSDVVPVACTLTRKALVVQKLQWSDIRSLAIKVTALDVGAIVELPRALAAAARELVDREGQCCGSWLAIDVSEADDSVTLRFRTSNPDGVPVIHEMIGVA